MKTLIIKNMSHDHDYRDAAYGLFDGEEILYRHVCSSIGFAPGDLIINRPERIAELKQKYGDFQVEWKDGTWKSEVVL